MESQRRLIGCAQIPLSRLAIVPMARILLYLASQLPLIVVAAPFAAMVGGVAGYGTGALMPLILVPIVGAEPVVPIIAISAMITNFAPIVAFRRRLIGAAR